MENEGHNYVIKDFVRQLTYEKALSNLELMGDTNRFAHLSKRTDTNCVFTRNIGRIVRRVDLSDRVKRRTTFQDDNAVAR